MQSRGYFHFYSLYNISEKHINRNNNYDNNTDTLFVLNTKYLILTIPLSGNYMPSLTLIFKTITIS